MPGVLASLSHPLILAVPLWCRSRFWLCVVGLLSIVAGGKFTDPGVVGRCRYRAGITNHRLSAAVKYNASIVNGSCPGVSVPSKREASVPVPSGFYVFPDGSSDALHTHIVGVVFTRSCVHVFRPR